MANKDGGLRLYLDYQRLNSVPIDLMPRTDSMIEQLNKLGRTLVFPINHDISFVNNRYRAILTTNNNREMQ